MMFFARSTSEAWAPPKDGADECGGTGGGVGAEPVGSVAMKQVPLVVEGGVKHVRARCATATAGPPPGGVAAEVRSPAAARVERATPPPDDEKPRRSGAFLVVP